MNTRLQAQVKAASTPTSSFTPMRAGSLQRKCACGGTPGPDGACAECRRRRSTLQHRSSDQAESSAVPPTVHEALRSPGQPLDANTRAFMEPRFGHDFSQVRVHTDAKAAESARAVNALAYTVGQHIAFEVGQYQPETTAGKRLLAHELTHIVQQVNGFQTKLAINQSGDQYEQGADRTALAITRGAPSPVYGQTGAGVMRQLMKQQAEKLKAGEPEEDSNVKELKDKPQQTGKEKVDKNGNSDEAVHWWAPLGERIAKWGFGGDVSYTNIDRKTIGEYTGPWIRNAFNAAVFGVGTGVVTEVVLKRLKLADMIAKATGLGVAFGVAYEGLDLRERIRCKTIDTYRWYGRYRYNFGNEEILAVEYWDKGPTEKAMISPVYYEQAIVDADGKVLFVNTDELSYYGIDLDAMPPTLPLFSYGKVDQD